MAIFVFLIVVFESKHAVKMVPPPHPAKQAQHNGFKGNAHTERHAGHTTAAAPDLAAGMKRRETNVSKIIILFGINN